MNTRLITPDGFPRADLDVAQSKELLKTFLTKTADSFEVRTTRSRIIHLKNDYKGLMNVIEKHIHEHFARQAANAASEEPLPAHAMDVDMVLPTRPPPQVLTPPFAKVNSVVEGSPAETAGLKAGDQIRNFGYVNNTNHDGLKKVGECVQGNEGVCCLFLLALGVAMLTHFSETYLSRF